MRLTLTLTLAVTYDVDGKTDVNDLENNLLAIAQRASREGWLTEDTNAMVVVADPTVEKLS